MFEKLFSVVFYFSAGYLSRKLKIFGEDASDVLIRFIIYFSFPSLVIYNVYNLDLKEDFLFVLVSGWVVIFFSIAVSFAVGRFLKLSRPVLASFVMMSSFGNTSFLGFPFQMALLGEEGLMYAVVFDQLASFLPVSVLSPFILSYGKGSSGFSIDFKRIITFPPFIAVVAGFLLKSVYIPDFILNSLRMLGMTVIPLALFSVGLNLRFSKVKERIKDISAVIFIKMFFVPILFILALYLSGISMDTQWKSAVIEISMPPMVLASILVVGAGLDRDLAVSSVGIGIILSFVSVPIMFYLAGLV